LATPAGIDRDYNFLVGIERGIERAEREVTEVRGIDVDALNEQEWRANGGRGRGNRGGMCNRRGDSNIAKAFERSGVIIEKAPKGMSREMSNMTTWSRK
jgi:hypothetical protein